MKAPIKILFYITTTAGLLFSGGCSFSTDHQKVIGTWVIRKDSSEMNVRFTKDSLILSYKPEKTRSAFKYEWREDKEKGLIECFTDVPTDSAKREHKMIPTPVYILNVNQDSLTLMIPKLKMTFSLGRDKSKTQPKNN